MKHKPNKIVSITKEKRQIFAFAYQRVFHDLRTAPFKVTPRNIKELIPCLIIEPCLLHIVKS